MTPTDAAAAKMIARSPRNPAVDDASGPTVGLPATPSLMLRLDEPSSSAQPNESHASLHVAIVAPNCSLKMGGEAAIPFHYFRLLRARGIDVHLVAHERTRAEMEAAFPADAALMHWAPENLVHRTLYLLGHLLPQRADRASFAFVARMYEEWVQRKLIRKLVRERGINVVHQPIPVSPAEPSMIHGVGQDVAVIIGPMNGGMNYPPAFKGRENRLEAIAVRLGRWVGRFANILIPGKRRARLLLVANDRTRKTLNRCVPRESVEVPENGVDLAVWSQPDSQQERRAPRPANDPVRFIYMGRLVDWKGVDLLLEAWAALGKNGFNAPRQLDIIGDGNQRKALAEQAKRLGIESSVHFHGWLSQPECAAVLRKSDVLVLPSLIECGAAVVLEAMACGLPVIATAWGGPSDYVDPSCGILVPPTSEKEFVAGLTQAMTQLGQSESLRREMGSAGQRKVTKHFCWEAKIEQMLQLYLNVLPVELASTAGSIKGASITTTTVAQRSA